MKYALDCWEYDIKAAGKTFLESKGYKLSDDKKRYVVEVGLIFRDCKDLQEEFYNLLKETLVDNLPPDCNIIRYYVDEVVVDRPVEIKSDLFTIKEKHLKFILVETPTSFVKVYDDHVKISKSFPLQAPDLWNSIASILNEPVKRHVRYEALSGTVRKFLKGKYPINNYIIKTRKGKAVIAYKSLLVEVTNDNLNKLTTDNLNEEVYYKLCFKYIHPLY